MQGRTRADGAILTIFAIVGIQLLSTAARAEIGEVDFEKAFHDAQLVPSDSSVKTKSDGKEITISTYVNPQSKNAVVDCKVDAMLLAKKAFELSKQLVRARVFFYSGDRKKYNEVDVTAGDVIAFGSGKMSNQQLMDSLNVKEIIVEPSAAADPAAAKSETAASAAATSAGNSGAANGESKLASDCASPAVPAAKPTSLASAAGPRVSDKKSVTAVHSVAKQEIPVLAGCQAGELQVYFPSKYWTLKLAIKEGHMGERRIAQLVSTSQTSDAVVNVNTHPKKMMEMYSKLWTQGNFQKRNVYLGKGNRYTGWEGGSYDFGNHWERQVFVVSPQQKIYSLELHCGKNEFQQMNAQFNYILSTVVFTAAR